MSAPEIVTFGCRLNAYESEIMRSHAAAAGITDTIIVNTCAVTAEAERQSRQTIRRMVRERPNARIVVTGCAAQIDPARFAAIDGVHVVLGNEEKLDPASYLNFGAAEHDATVIHAGDIMNVTETAPHLIEGFEDRARAFVQVQQGCDHRCTFCIIPYGRGPSRSLPLGALVSQVRTLVANGFREVVLTGVDITAYGGDLPGRPTLGQMTRRLLAQAPELGRLRLSSLDPVEIDDDLFRLIAEEKRLLPYFHLSLQAGDDTILKRMKRRHSRADAVAFCDRVRQLRPDAVFGADLIAGFPTETEDMFAATLALVDDCGLTYLHVFPYSERPDTPAARMPMVPMALRRERAARLRQAGSERLRRFLDGRIGATARVLVEKDNRGRCEHFATVCLDGDAMPGEIVIAEITSRSNERL
ncbi:MAG: tRNA (N(6)-L-threonylcarbamoyladenosine(37)-C(2))-methylthiotransferase MtaB, partial [Alphaproteobacteria bacterium]